MFCSRCGKEIDNKSEQCPYCNALIENNVSAQNNANGKSGLISLILGSIGLLMAWVVALFGYALGGVGLAFGIKALKNEKEAKGIIGFIFSIVTLIFAVINSILGLMIMLQMM